MNADGTSNDRFYVSTSAKSHGTELETDRSRSSEPPDRSREYSEDEDSAATERTEQKNARNLFGVTSRSTFGFA